MCSDAYREALTRNFSSKVASAQASTPAPTQGGATKDGSTTKRELAGERHAAVARIRGGHPDQPQRTPAY
jgi:hypothetical protein